MWKKIAKFLLTIFWPEIKKFLAKYVKEALTYLERRLKEIFGARNDANAKDADARAQQAAENAARSTDPNEAEKWRAIADVWREVAEKFRRENEALKEELASARKQTEEKTDANLGGLALEDAFEVSADDIRHNDGPFLLPGNKA